MAAVDFEKLEHPDLSNSRIHEIVEKKVRLKFQQANPRLQLITEGSATSKIRRAFDSAHLLDNKKLKSKKKKHFSDALDKLFDLMICQCDIEDCGEEDHNCGGVHVMCNCELKNKVPQVELAWLKDQRDKIGTKGGKFFMSGVDKVEAKIYSDKVKREAKKALNEEIRRNKVEQEQLTNAEQLESEEFEIDNIATVNEDNNNDSEFKAVLRPSRGQQSEHNQNRINLDFFIAEVVRYGW